jgi:Uma2 family endonuclease
MIVEKQYTADDLMRLTERYELVEGKLVKMAPAGGKHGMIAMRVSRFLILYLEENPLGELVAAETGFYTQGDEHTVRAPDLALMPSGVEIGDGYLKTPPLLVAEVVSPHDRASEVEAKTQEWLAFGVQSVWVVYPATQSVYVYGQGNPTIYRDLLTDPNLPGFEMKVEDLFK